MVDLGSDFRDDSRFGPRGNRTVEGEETRLTSHHFDKEKPFVGRGRVADLIHGFHNGIQCRIVSDRRIGTEQVVIDGSGHSDDREIVFRRENARSAERTVAADHHQCVDALGGHVLIGEFAAFGCHELHAAGRLEDRTPLLDDVAYVLGFERDDLIGDQSFVTPHDPFDLKAVINCGTRDRPDCRVHARRIAAGCQNADTLDLSHSIPFCFYCANLAIITTLHI